MSGFPQTDLHLLSDRCVPGDGQVCDDSTLSIVNVSLALREARMREALVNESSTGANVGRDGRWESVASLQLPQQFVFGMESPLWRADAEVRAKRTVVVLSKAVNAIVVSSWKPFRGLKALRRKQLDDVILGGMLSTCIGRMIIMVKCRLTAQT